MIVLVNFSDENMTQAQALCTLSAKKNGVDTVWSQNPETITDEFRDINKEVFSQPRGYGYWLWKPYFIYKALIKLNEGDVLIYADSGVEFVAPVHEVIRRMDEDIFFFTNGFPHHEWCKGQVMYSINWRDQAYGDGFDDWFKQKKQVQASVIFFKVNQKTKNLVKEWLMWAQMPGFIDDSPNNNDQGYNSETFAEHRHDQAILTCLQIKYGYKLHFWPTLYSEHIRHTAQPEDNYPTLFNHHRKRNSEW